VRVVTLWHGTTKSAAEQIAVSGFQPPNIASIIDAVGREHGHAVAEVRGVLEATGRFSIHSLH
jgi:hypothetical protein